MLHNTIPWNFYKYVDRMMVKLKIKQTINMFHKLHFNIFLYPVPELFLETGQATCFPHLGWQTVVLCCRIIEATCHGVVPKPTTHAGGCSCAVVVPGHHPAV